MFDSLCILSTFVLHALGNIHAFFYCQTFTCAFCHNYVCSSDLATDFLKGCINPGFDLGFCMIVSPTLCNSLFFKQLIFQPVYHLI